MRYQTAEAYSYDGLAYERELTPDVLTPLEGGRLDARARRGVSPALVRVIGYVVAVAIALFVAGGVSVALTSGTVALLQTNAATTSQIKQTRAQNGDLRIERSLLTSSDRISKIATQNYGMVYANDAQMIAID